MYRRIVVAVDIGSLEKGERILKKARSLLDDGGEIIALTVVEEMPGYVTVELPPDLLDNAVCDSKLQLEALQARTGIAMEIEIRLGPTAREILACATDHAADLIIVASHLPDFSNYFIGATADRVVRHATCSVLVDRSA
jgi:nucleotide-binding universal stress UspA family protein